jgi:branched-chain amino acid transport system permease protein
MKVRSNLVMVRHVFLVIAGIAILLFPLYGKGEAAHVAIVGLMGAIGAIGLNLFFGYCGQINFGAAGFMAIGGYGVALLEKYTGMPYFICLTLSIVAAGLIALIVSIPLLRLREYMLALGTLAFGLGLYETVSKGFTQYTHGEDGIDMVPLILFGRSVGDGFFFYVFLGATCLCLWISYSIRHSRTGRALLAISQDETAAASLGVNIDKYLMLTFALSGMMIALGGGLFVKWSHWCSPEFFSLMPSITILLAVVVGGVGSAFGAVLGGIIMFSLREFLVPLALYDMLAFGVILCLFLLFMPKGIMGGVTFLATKMSGVDAR